MDGDGPAPNAACQREPSHGTITPDRSLREIADGKLSVEPYIRYRVVSKVEWKPALLKHHLQRHT